MSNRDRYPIQQRLARQNRRRIVCEFTARAAWDKTSCFCSGRKRTGDPFCRHCYGKLPMPIRLALRGEDRVAAYLDAIELLYRASVDIRRPKQPGDGSQGR